MSPEISSVVPRRIQTAYDISTQDTVTFLDGGQVNETLLVESNERQFILRKLAPVLGAGTVRSTHIVSQHLTKAGWEAPNIEPTVSGDLFVANEGRLWHAMSYIPSDNAPPSQADTTPTLTTKAGQLVGSWHQAVRSLDHTPASLPHFHDTDYIAGKLLVDMSALVGRDEQGLAGQFLNEHHKQTISYPGEPQIIHGDPKLENMLYRGGEPFTIIDLDCMMLDSPWTDIGDALRSVSAKLVNVGQNPNDVISGFVDGYVEATDSTVSLDEAHHLALSATRRIASELGMRYLSDIVDGQRYFSWNKDLYNSRSEALLDKARLQWKVVQTMSGYLNDRKLVCVE